jgi:uncharacterized repeat protein (TIGR04076 family)
MEGHRMEKKHAPFTEETSPDDFQAVLAGINSQYEELTILKVSGHCPYGHKAGEKFTITSMNTDGLCGSLFANIVPSVFTTHYGGGLPWEKETGVFRGLCPEMGKVEVEVRRIKKGDAKVLKTKKNPKVVTGIGFDVLDKYRLYLEILGIERHCTYGHVAGQKVEVDPFNTGNICGFLYWAAYRFINLLLKDGSLPWEAEPHIIHGVCPDPYNVTTFKLTRENR